MPNVTPEQIKQARLANLYDFLLSHHPDAVKREGNSLRLRSNHSVSVKRGYSGFSDWSTGKTGNSVDFLTQYLSYSLPDAVLALLSVAPARPAPIPEKTFTPPEAVSERFSRMYAYLSSRAIPADVIQQLIHLGLLYQERTYNNAVFINEQRTYAELRGTLSSRPFHGLVPGSSFTDCWSFTGDNAGISLAPAQLAIACESAIDAISLYCLQRGNIPQPVRYCSIGGVANQQRIDALKGIYPQLFTAMDNDDAGNACRQRNRDLLHYCPNKKDWNDDLQAKKNRTT